MERRFISILASLAGVLVASGLAAAEELEDRAIVRSPAPHEKTGSFWADPHPIGDPLDIRFTDLTLERAVRFLAGEETNVVAAPDVTGGTLSLDLRGVYPAQALDYLLQREALAAGFEGNTVFLSPRETRVYEIPLVLQEKSPIWDEIGSGIEELRSQDGVVALNKTAGILTIEDHPSELDRVERHLREVLYSVLRQVEIEVKILEVVFQANEGVGIDWRVFDGILDPAWNLVGGTQTGDLSFQAITDHRSVFQLGILKPGKWQTFLDAFDEDIELNMISRPRITAMSNQPAKFDVRERIPYLTKTVTHDEGTTISEFQLEFEEAGINLNLTASVSENGVTTMEVHPIISTVVGFTQSLPDLGPEPIIDTRETRSTVRLPEGHSLVMSGLMQDRENTTTLGVPILSKVPLVGRLFRSEKVRRDKTEVVIVLTPRLRQEPAVGTLAEHDRVRRAGVRLVDRSVRSRLAAARTGRAWVRLVSGDAVGALAMMESATRVRPAAWWALNDLGLAQREAGFLPEAEATLRRAVQAQEPAEPVALLNLGTLLLHRGESGDALPLLEAAAERAPFGPVRDEALLAWALALEFTGRTVEALNALETAGGPDGRLAARIRPRVERMRAGTEGASVVP